MTDGPILRLFEVKVKDGCQERLLQHFAKTSAGVVADEPGNAGYFFGKMLDGSDDIVMFASVWDDLDAIRRRFGPDWQSAFLPEGYEALIADCSIRHFDLSSGWHVENTA